MQGAGLTSPSLQKIHIWIVLLDWNPASTRFLLAVSLVYFYWFIFNNYPFGSNYTFLEIIYLQGSEPERMAFKFDAASLLDSVNNQVHCCWVCVQFLLCPSRRCLDYGVAVIPRTLRVKSYGFPQKSWQGQAGVS